MITADPISFRLGLTGAALSLFIALGQASSPVFWRVSTQAQFLQGEVENVSVDTTGELLLGPDMEVVYETTAPFLWSAEAADGALWVGSGNDGKVFRIGRDGAGREVFDANELNVHALSATDGSAAYVGTSPGGAVFRITVDGDAQTIFDPEEQYIWAIATNPAEAGTLYVATGDPGRIYRVSPDGNATLFYDTMTTHVLALAFDHNGNVLAGTGSPGQIFRIGPDGRAFVVLESPFSEIRALRVASNGVVYAVAASQSQARSQPSSATTQSNATGAVTMSTSASVTAVVSTTPSSDTASLAPTPSPSPTAAGAIYRIMPDGIWDVVWESEVDVPYDVALGAPGMPVNNGEQTRTLLIGTGGNGKIFKVVEEPRRVVLLTRAPAQQVTQFVATSDGAHYYVTSNPGKIYRLAAGRATIGSYLSEVRDTETISTWGTIQWRAVTPAGTSVRLFTRTGNTGIPNETWSPWSESYAEPSGSQITSPKARYLQWKAELNGVDETPALLSVTTAYLPRNLQPEISDLTVHDPGVVFQQPFSGTDPPIAGLIDNTKGQLDGTSSTNADTQQSTLGRSVFRKGLQTFVWMARDQNQDQLQFDVFYRSESDLVWNTLAEQLSQSIFTWDTTSAPDGTYVVRVAATDALANPPGMALTGEIESTPFDIDNSPPRIELGSSNTQADQITVAFIVSDTHSPVRHVEYSLDSQRWQVVYPVDGIPDSRIEQFQITIASTSREHLVIRATDAMGNTVTAAGI